jgi:hypothetical protein
MKNKNIIIGVMLFVLGAVVGGLLLTRHYGVGPLATLGGVKTRANVGTCSDLWAHYNSDWIAFNKAQDYYETTGQGHGRAQAAQARYLATRSALEACLDFN